MLIEYNKCLNINNCKIKNTQKYDILLAFNIETVGGTCFVAGRDGREGRKQGKLNT